MTKSYATIAAFENGGLGQGAYDLRPVGMFIAASLTLSVAVFYNNTTKEIVLVTLA